MLKIAVIALHSELNVTRCSFYSPAGGLRQDKNCVATSWFEFTDKQL